MIDLIRTGVFATDDERKGFQNKISEVANIPVISLTGKVEDDWTVTARRELLQACHLVALKHGLPEIQGYYGMDLTTGEFVRY